MRLSERLPSSLRGPLADLAKVARELLALPAGAALRLAELIGLGVLRVMRALWPALRRAWSLLGRLVAVASREVTPARTMVVVTALLLLALAGSQLVDYRSVAVGVPDYSAAGVEGVAPAPPIDTGSSTEAHGTVIWLLVAAGVAVTLLALLRGRKVARLLALVGAAAIVIGLAVDRPAGLDAGRAAVAYEGVEATLQEGFWAQLAAGAALIVAGPLLAAALGAPAPARRSAESERRPGRRRRLSLPQRRHGRAAEPLGQPRSEQERERDRAERRRRKPPGSSTQPAGGGG